MDRVVAGRGGLRWSPVQCIPPRFDDAVIARALFTREGISGAIHDPEWRDIEPLLPAESVRAIREACGDDGEGGNVVVLDAVARAAVVSASDQMMHEFVVPCVSEYAESGIYDGANAARIAGFGGVSVWDLCSVVVEWCRAVVGGDEWRPQHTAEEYSSARRMLQAGGPESMSDQVLELADIDMRARGALVRRCVTDLYVKAAACFGVFQRIVQRLVCEGVSREDPRPTRDAWGAVGFARFHDRARLFDLGPLSRVGGWCEDEMRGVKALDELRHASDEKLGELWAMHRRGVRDLGLGAVNWAVRATLDNARSRGVTPRGIVDVMDAVSGECSGMLRAVYPDLFPAGSGEAPTEEAQRVVERARCELLCGAALPMWVEMAKTASDSVHERIEERALRYVDDALPFIEAHFGCTAEDGGLYYETHPGGIMRVKHTAMSGWFGLVVEPLWPHVLGTSLFLHRVRETVSRWTLESGAGVLAAVGHEHSVWAWPTMRAAYPHLVGRVRMVSMVGSSFSRDDAPVNGPSDAPESRVDEAGDSGSDDVFVCDPASASTTATVGDLTGIRGVEDDQGNIETGLLLAEAGVGKFHL